MSQTATKTRRKSSKAKAPPLQTETAIPGRNGHGPASLGPFYAVGPVFGLGAPVQAKFTVGKADDPFEREADAVAERVTTGRFAPPISPVPLGGLESVAQTQTDREELEESTRQPLSLQRQAMEEEPEEEIRVTAQPLLIQRQGAAEPETEEPEEEIEEPSRPLPIQRQVADEESEPAEGTADEEWQETATQPLLTQQAADASGSTPSLQSAATSSMNPQVSGTSINPATRSVLEAGIGADFSDVRVHQDSAALRAAASLKARAFTHQNHILLGQGETQSDLSLMAHEATHVVQQNANGIQRMPLPNLQRQDDQTAAGEEADPATQSFSFSTDDIESRLESTPSEGAATQESDVELAPQTESNLEEVESESEEEQAPEGEEEDEEAAEEDREGEEESAAEEASTLAAESPGAVEPPGSAPPMPASAAEYEGIVDDQVSQYLDENASPDSLSQLDETTQSLLEGASELSQRQVTQPEQGSLLGQLTGITPLVESFARVSPGYEQEETWLQVVAQIRDITGTLGGVVGMIGLVATVSGLILSLLIPPVGAFLLTAGRFCDLAALILDAVSFALGIFLTAYNRYRLKNATDPEEKARLLALVRQDAMKTVMSGIAVATAIAPGAARMIGSTRLGRAATQRLGSVASRAGRGLSAAGRAVSRSRAGRAIAGSLVGRGASAFGRGARAIGRGTVGLGKSALVRARGTSPIRWANKVTGQLEERARGYFRNLATRNTRVGRFYNRRIRGFHERNVRTAEMINDPIERQYQQRLGREITDFYDDLRRQGINDVDQLTSRVRQQFGDRAGDFRVVRRKGKLRMRDDSDVLREVREHEFTEIQLIRQASPGASAAELTEQINRSPFIKGRWTVEEIDQFRSLHPDVRQSGQLVSGAVPKTAHHTIPAQMAPQIHRNPRFMQVVNDPRFYYDDFLVNVYSNYRTLPKAKTVQVPGARAGQTRQAQNTREALQGMVDDSQFTVPNRDFFASDQFIREIREQGSTGAWVNPRNPNERWLFNPHFVLGHSYDWKTEVARQIFDLNARLGLRGEPIRQLLAPALRQATRIYRESQSGGQSTDPSLGSAESLTRGSSSLINTALTAGAQERRRASGQEAISASLSGAGQGVAGPHTAMGLPPTLTLATLGEEAGSESSTADTGSMPVPTTTGETSRAFMNALSQRMAQPVVTFASAGSGPAATLGAASDRATSVSGTGTESLPTAPPDIISYSPGELAHIRESRSSIVTAIEAVQDYISATQEAERDNELARRASEILVARNEEQQTAIEGEREDVARQQRDLDQARGAQQEMTAEGERASAESERGKSESENVQSEGSDVSVEAKPEEPRKKSWLERAWDATAGAVWRRLVRPVIRAAKRKVSQVMQGLNNFITDMINQALGLDDIEAEIAAGGENIQERGTSLQETDGGLVESNAAAVEEQQQNEANIEQANSNIDDVRTIRSDAEQLLAALIAHHDLLQQEEDAAADYIRTFGFQYQEFFEYAEEQAEETETSEPQSEIVSEEERVTQGHVMPVVSYIDALEDAERRAGQELADVAAESAGSITPELQSGEREAAGTAQSQLGTIRSAHSARLLALRSEAMECLGQPASRGLMKLEQIMDELLSIAEELEQERIAALQTISDVHSQATMAGGASVAG